MYSAIGIMFVIQLVLYRCRLTLCNNGCSTVGLADKNIIPDSSFTASSFYSSDYAPHKARLNSISYGWAPERYNRDESYIQVDLGAIHSICAVATQGSNQMDEWVTRYSLEYSPDASFWRTYQENGRIKEFIGNRDRDTVVKHPLSSTPRGRYIRISPKGYHYWPTLRFEVYGDADLCDPNPCQNGGSCREDAKGYTCSCPVGYTGKNCEVDIDECASSPCQNGGLCRDWINNYTCTCQTGFTGKICQTNIDDCLPNPCLNGGVCEDGINSHRCKCALGFTGYNCTTNIDDCATNPCQNGGTCTDGVGNFTCTCAVGYTGYNCTIDINDCLHNPCQNGGQCIDGINNYTCSCAAGYTGYNCTIDIDDCAPNPCQNNGVCKDGINNYTCSCQEGFTDPNCNTNIDDCSPNPCQNGATCLDGINNYTCACADGFMDYNCSTNIDDCAPNPCANGGTCTDAVASYNCSCIPGYTGHNCTINIDDCSPNPCQNGGKCTDGVNSYNCSCIAGYGGYNCSINIDDCFSNPCKNGGTCLDGINNYTCSCVAGFTDYNCTTDIDDCTPNPCKNSGNCSDGINNYTCSCAAGYTGYNCATNINECSSNPCENHGICVDGINDYKCVCMPRYSGKNCQTETQNGEISKMSNTIVIEISVVGVTWNPKLKDSSSAAFRTLAARIKTEVWIAYIKSGLLKSLEVISFKSRSREDFIARIQLHFKNNTKNIDRMAPLKTELQDACLGRLEVEGHVKPSGPEREKETKLLMLAVLVTGAIAAVFIIISLAACVRLCYRNSLAARKRRTEKHRDINNPVFPDQPIEMPPLANNSLKPARKYSFKTFFGSLGRGVKDGVV